MRKGVELRPLERGGTELSDGLTMRYATLRTLLTAMFGIEGDKPTRAFEDRIKNLKRLDFPPSVRGSDAARIDYTLDDAIGLAAAIRLIGAYVPPAAAIRLIDEGMPNVMLMACDALSMAIAGAQANDAARTILVFAPGALGDLGTRPPRAGRYDAPVGGTTLHVIVDGGAASLTADRGKATAKDGVVVDALSFSAMLSAGLKATGLDAREILSRLTSRSLTLIGRPDAPPVDDGALYLWHASRFVDALEAHMANRAGPRGVALALTDLRMVMTPDVGQRGVAALELTHLQDWPGMTTIAFALAALADMTGHPASVVTSHMPETPRMSILRWTGAKDARDLLAMVRRVVEQARM